MKTITSFLLVVACLGVADLWAGDSAKSDLTREVLRGVPAAELPAKAAGLIQHAKAADQGTLTVKVVKAALDLNPAAAPAVVGAIARAVPDMAAIAAGSAAEVQPKQASAIARAAAAAAPSKTGKIVTAVCRAVPNDYRNIAVAVAQVAPDSTKEILNAVSAALPDLKPFIAQSVAGYAGNGFSVGAALDQAGQSSQAIPAGTSTPPPVTMPQPVGFARGPAIGPPYIPLSGTPTNVVPGNGGEVPTGGRGYAAP